MLKLFGDIAARLITRTIQTTTGAVLKVRGGVDLARRLRDDPDHVAALERRASSAELHVYTLGVERDFMRDQLHRASLGQEPTCLGAILYRCEPATPCDCCQLASRLRIPAATPKRSRARKAAN